MLPCVESEYMCVYMEQFFRIKEDLPRVCAPRRLDLLSSGWPGWKQMTQVANQLPNRECESGAETQMFGIHMDKNSPHTYPEK